MKQTVALKEKKKRRTELIRNFNRTNSANENKQNVAVGYSKG
jgi:hypothetical protein